MAAGKGKRARRRKLMMRAGSGSRRRSCRFCADKNLAVDYKEVKLLKHFVAESGAIVPRRISGTCAKHQRKVTTAVKRARIVALLPFANRGV